MPRLDRDYAREVVGRAERIAPDQKPAWGKMTPAQLRGHLVQVLRYTAGDIEIDMPDRGTWMTKRLFRPLVLRGIVAIPKNVRLPKPKGMKERPPMAEGTAEELQAALDSFLEKQEAGTLPSRLHPFFGVLSPAQWSQFHVRHIEHHLKQFGA